MKRVPNILICPLDWGIGHATRCVPIIHELIKQKARVFIGAANRPLAFLKQEFPELEFIDFPGHAVSYPSNENHMVLKMASQIPALIKAVKTEHHRLTQLIDQYKINGIISDNRYGLYSSKIPSIFMTHQVFLKTPPHLRFLDPFLLHYNYKYIKRFSEYWIPDVSGNENLSGDLSHKKKLPGNAWFIGPLSRFSSLHQNENLNRKNEKWDYELLVILSGPEPQRSILEKIITEQISRSFIRAAIVQGKPERRGYSSLDANPRVFSHLDSRALYELIMKSKVVISRSGYSSLMDMSALGKQAVFIPTPGQTEQEYLAKYHQIKGRFYSISQDKFDLGEVLEKTDSFPGFHFQSNSKMLESRIHEFLEKAGSSSD